MSITVGELKFIISNIKHFLIDKKPTPNSKLCKFKIYEIFLWITLSEVDQIKIGTIF